MGASLERAAESRNSPIVEKWATRGELTSRRTEKGLNSSCGNSLREVSMPVYDYVCKDCQHSFELVLTLSEHDKDNIRCPKCEGKNVEQDAAAFYAVTSKKS